MVSADGTTNPCQHLFLRVVSAINGDWRGTRGGHFELN